MGFCTALGVGRELQYLIRTYQRRNVAYGYTGDSWYNGAANAILGVPLAAMAIVVMAAPSRRELEPYLVVFIICRDTLLLGGKCT